MLRYSLLIISMLFLILTKLCSPKLTYLFHFCCAGSFLIPPVSSLYLKPCIKVFVLRILRKPSGSRKFPVILLHQFNANLKNSNGYKCKLLQETAVSISLNSTFSCIRMGGLESS